MRSFFILAFMCFFCSCVLAQQHEIDSMLNELKKHPDGDTNRVKILNDLSYTYYQLNPDEGIRRADEAIALTKKLNNNLFLATSLARKGLNYAEKGAYSTALDLYNTAAAVFDSLKDERRLFSVTNSTAIVYMRLSTYPKALELYFKNLSLAEKRKRESDIAICVGNIALVYTRMQNYQQALLFNQRAIDIQQKRNDEKALADLLNSRGNMLDSKSEPAKALPYYRQSLALSKKLNYVKGINSAATNLGNVFNELEQYDSAIYYIKSCYAFYKQTDDQSNLAVYYSFMGSIVTKAADDVLIKYDIKPSQRYQAAVDYFRQSLTINTAIEDVASQAENWQNISAAYKKAGQPANALEALEKYTALRDSVLSDEKIEAIKQSELQYAVQRNEDSLMLVQQQKDLQAKADLNRQSTIKKALAAGSGILFTAALVSFIFYKKRRDAKQQQQEAEFRTEVADTEMKALRAQMNPHFIFNSLNSISDYIARNDVQMADRYLTKFAKLMRMILENSEQKNVLLCDDLKALELYMKLEAVRMNNKFTYEIKVDEDIDQETILVPPLILQPFVENSIWHGIAQKEGPGKILIHIKKEGADMINCVVEDNGVGRKQSASVKTTVQQSGKTSLGMKITQARIDILNKLKNTKAVVELSDLAQGLRVEVKLPLATNF